MESLSTNKKQFFDIIQNFFALDKLSHAYLIEIDNYDTDMSYIYTFVKMILCKKQKNMVFDPSCSSCNLCHLIDNGQYPDLMVIEPEGQWIKRNQLMELKSEYQNKSMLNNKRIYIIKQADKLNSSSANTILKFLEEPEEDIIAILVTTNRYQILETILSRCQILSLKESQLSSSFSDNAFLLLKYMLEKESLFIHYSEILEQILIDKETTKTMIFEIENICIDYLNYCSDSAQFSSTEQIISAFKNTNMQQIVKIIQILEEEKEKLVYNVNYKLWLDSLFARLIGV